LGAAAGNSGVAGGGAAASAAAAAGGGGVLVVQLPGGCSPSRRAAIAKLFEGAGFYAAELPPNAAWGDRPGVVRALLVTHPSAAS
jgi:hypothetical protein